MSGAQTDLTLEDTRDGAVLRFAGRLVVAGLAPLERAAAAVKAEQDRLEDRDIARSMSGEAPATDEEV